MQKLFLILLFICLGTNYSYADIIGKPLPNLKGNTLSGRELEIPKDIKGKITFVSMGFTRESSKKSEIWLRNFIAKYIKVKDIEFYAFPMIGDNIILKSIGSLIEKGLKKQIQKEGYDHAMIIYQPLSPIKKYIDYSNKYDTYLYLSDKNGNVVWSARGDFNVQKFDQLEAVIKTLTN